jgi:hypothetical protein
MADPVEISKEEALEILRQASAARALIDNPIPTERERWKGAICLFIAVVLFAIALHVTHRVFEMYKEMEIEGGLPYLTMCFVDTAMFFARYPWVLTSGLFMMAWTYFSVIARRKRRIAVFNTVLCIIALFGMLLTPVALFLPMVGITYSIGK